MKDFLSISMIKEQIRRLKLPAMILTFLAAFGVIMELILVVLMGYGHDTDWIVPSVWYVYLTPVVVLILSSILIHDYRTRNGSDFYHALPVSRRSVVVSSALACMCWVIVYMVFPAVIQSVLKFLFMLKPLDLGPYFDAFCYGLIVSFYLSGALWLGHALTGTRMSHVVVTILILAGPRALLFVVGVIIETLMPYLMLFRFDFLFVPHKYNYALSCMSSYGPSATSAVYTIILSILYYALALWLIKKKPSETAGRPTWNTRMETAVRVLLACAICLPAILGVLMFYFDVNGYDSYSDTSQVEFLMLMIVFYSLAVIVYFLYEILQTKKIKNSFKHWKGLGWVALFNLIIIMSVIFIHRSVMRTQPDPDEIESVSIMDIRKESFSNWVNDYIDVNYGNRKFQDSDNEAIFDGLIYDIPLTSEYVRKTVSDELTDAIGEGKDYIHSAYINTGILQMDYVLQGSSTVTDDSVKEYIDTPGYRRYSAGLKIKLKNGKTIYRQLNLPIKVYLELTGQPAFLERVQGIDLEKMINGYKKTLTYGFDIYGGNGSIYGEVGLLMDAFESDVKEMTPEQKRDLLFHPTIYLARGEVTGYYDEWIRIKLYSQYDLGSIGLAISPEICPTFYPYAEGSLTEMVNIRKILNDLQFEEGGANVSD